ncbi:hypothetical protein AWC38_SpisGene15856 [Stylophora pistillata]|uniref:Uncharacterized protein n=1 Tax=Stylophora pistillata TaxID=50429 RepID=A0A2B4RSD6_STYPI|nr:hypothetical protein AWC38_SpisGene15856 [Stylophora pistillata]
MKTVIVLNTESDSSKAHALKNHLRGRMQNVPADLRNIIDILAEDQDFKAHFHHSDCVLLIGSRQASSLLRNKQQETEDEFITFDGKFIHDELTENKELVKNKLVMVFLTERSASDWIPAGLDERRIFDLLNEKIHRVVVAMGHRQYKVRKMSQELAIVKEVFPIMSDDKCKEHLSTPSS